MLIGEPQPQARRAETTVLFKRSEKGEPQPQARRAETKVLFERAEKGEPQGRREESGDVLGW